MKHSKVSREAASSWAVFPELEPPERDGSVQSPRLNHKRPVFRDDPNAIRLDNGYAKTVTMSFANMNEYGTLLVNYLRARRSVFIERLGWSLSQAEGMEFDQYDNPFCRWVVLYEFGEVLGGVRLTPTTARCGTYSYMLRDAQMGKLENIPRDVLFFDAPVEKRVWEASRLFVADTVPAKHRHTVQNMLMNEMSTAARKAGATQVIGIVPAVWSRWLRRLGLGAVPVGPKFSIDGTTSQAALFNVNRYVN
jgi:N-acyl-L-homoserine lactone synthetase